MKKLGIKIFGEVEISELKSGIVVFRNKNAIHQSFLERLTATLSGDILYFVSLTNLFDLDNQYGDIESSQNSKSGIAYRVDSDYEYLSTISEIITPVNEYAVRVKGVFTAMQDDFINSLYLGRSFNDSDFEDVFNSPVAYLDKSSNKTQIINGIDYKIEWEIVFEDVGY